MTNPAGRTRSYVAQQASALVLRVYAGVQPADTRWVLDERNLSLGAWQLHAQIVGASHVAVIARAGCAITEVLVAHPVHESIPEPLQVLPAVPGGPVEYRTPCWEYRQEIRCLELDPAAITILEQQLRDGMRQGFSAAYPADATGQRGWTALCWQADADCLRLETYHTYPEEGSMVLTAAICRAGISGAPCSCALRGKRRLSALER